MSSYVFDNVKLKLAKGEITFFAVPDGAYKLALVTSAAFQNIENGALSDNEFWSDVSGTEITQNINYNTQGYNGHQDLKNVGLLEVDVNGLTQLKISATDISFPISKIDADGVIIYRNDINKTLIEAIHFGQKVSSNNGVFIIELSKNGWIRIH